VRKDQDIENFLNQFRQDYDKQCCSGSVIQKDELNGKSTVNRCASFIQPKVLAPFLILTLVCWKMN
jgi:hypothetical protein